MNNKKKRIFDIIQIGYVGDVASRTFDIAITAAIIINLFIAIFDTFEQSIPYQPVLDVIEWITVIGFTIEYILRVWTAEYLYPNKCTGIARIKYIFSGSGIVDLLSFLPNYLPVFFPAGAVAFRMFRVIRILRIFRVNSYYDALNVITEVIRRKRDQILSSVFIIVMLIIASSLCMYSLEHEAQPEVFKNAFSGIWWSVSTLLTVGYGDALIGMIYGRTHTRDVRELSGLMKIMPFLAVCYVIAGLANLGLPGLSGFVAEMTIFNGAFQHADVFHRTWTIIACTSIVITAVYILRLVGKILYGTCTNKHHLTLTDATWDERTAVIILIVCVAGLGIAPLWISTMIGDSVLPMVSIFQ